jgi:hypothetical protein
MIALVTLVQGTSWLPKPAQPVDCRSHDTGCWTDECPDIHRCGNSGGIPRDVYWSFVGDCVCDCCDGSDEASGVCANTCADEREAVLDRLVELAKAPPMEKSPSSRRLKQLKADIESAEDKADGWFATEQDKMRSTYAQYSLDGFETLAKQKLLGPKSIFADLYGRCLNTTVDTFVGTTAVEEQWTNFLYQICFHAISQKLYSYAIQQTLNASGAPDGDPTMLGALDPRNMNAQLNVLDQQPLVFSQGEFCHARGHPRQTYVVSAEPVLRCGTGIQTIPN